LKLKAGVDFDEAALLRRNRNGLSWRSANYWAFRHFGDANGLGEIAAGLPAQDPPQTALKAVLTPGQVTHFLAVKDELREALKDAK
jgi:hypothetical protein